MILASFCAEKIAFIIGMYDVERSGDTDKTSMRGSGSMVGSKASVRLLEVKEDGRVMRFTSEDRVSWFECTKRGHVTA